MKQMKRGTSKWRLRKKGKRKKRRRKKKQMREKRRVECARERKKREKKRKEKWHHDWAQLRCAAPPSLLASLRFRQKKKGRMR